MPLLDERQILQKVLNDTEDRLRVEINATVVAGAVEVAIDQTTDSIKIGDGTDIMLIDSDGSANVRVTAPLPSGSNTIGVVDQGDPNVIANGWPVKVTDGTDVMLVNPDGSINVTGTITTSPDVNIHDGAGNSLTSQVSGGQRALDVGINVAGVQVDPRQIRALTSADTVTVVQPTGSNLHVQVDNFPATQPVSGTVAVTQSTTPWIVDGSGVTQPISAVSLPLPSGAATAAKQDTGNTSLASIDSKLTNPLPISGTVAATQSGTWNITNVSGTVSLPTGASTATRQDTGNASLASIDAKLTNPLPVSGTVTSNQGTAGALAGAWPVKITEGTVILGTTSNPLQISSTQLNNNISFISGATGDIAGGVDPGIYSLLAGGMYNTVLPSLSNGNQAALQLDSSSRLIIAPLTNTSVVKVQLQDNAGTAIVLGQAVMASSVPVVIASNQSAVPASQSGTWNINNVSGTVSLPTGASTAAKQDTGNASLASIDSKLTNPLPVSGTVAATQSGTWSTRTQDGSGNSLTSQVSGAQRALDVGVNVAGVQVDPRAASPGTLTDRSGTATAASATLMSANSSRKYLIIQNLSNNQDMWINFTTAATNASPSLRVAAGVSFSMEGSFISTEQINVIRGGGSNVSFTAKEG